MKKAMILLLAAALATSAFAGCNRQNNTASSEPPSQAESLPGEEEPSQEDISDSAEAVSLELILDNIAAAYGSDFLATAPMEEEYIAASYPEITDDLVEEMQGRMAMITMHPDEVIVVRAVPGQSDAVERLLGTIRDRKADDSLQYPMNMPKTAAAQVVRHGDYVAYIMLGAPLDDNEADEQAYKEHFEAEAEKGVTAFFGTFA